MLKAAVMPTTQKMVKHDVEDDSSECPGRSCEKICARMPETIRNTAASGHADEKFDLMMEQAAVVQEADDGDEGSARENADDLLQRRAVQCEQNREQKPR